MHLDLVVVVLGKYFGAGHRTEASDFGIERRKPAAMLQ